MVNNSEQDSEKRRIPQGAQTIIPQLNKIGASTPYDFDGKNLTAYGGPSPVATMLEKLAELGAKAATFLRPRSSPPGWVHALARKRAQE